jgi:hypothetical protein
LLDQLSIVSPTLGAAVLSWDLLFSRDPMSSGSPSLLASPRPPHLSLSSLPSSGPPEQLQPLTQPLWQLSLFLSLSLSLTTCLRLSVVISFSCYYDLRTVYFSKSPSWDTSVQSDFLYENEPVSVPLCLFISTNYKLSVPLFLPSFSVFAA